MHIGAGSPRRRDKGNGHVMATDIKDILRQQVGRALQEAIGGEQKKSDQSGGGSGKGILAGAALAAAAPLARRGLQAYRSGELNDFVSKLGTGEALEDVRARFNDGDESGQDEDERGQEEDP